jgi:hypothetical protein
MVVSAYRPKGFRKRMHMDLTGPVRTEIANVKAVRRGDHKRSVVRRREGAKRFINGPDSCLVTP